MTSIVVFIINSLRNYLEDCAESVVATSFRCAIQLAVRANDQPRAWNRAIFSRAKAMQLVLGPGPVAGRNQLVGRTESCSATGPCRAVEISGGIESQSAGWTRAVRTASTKAV